MHCLQAGWSGITQHMIQPHKSGDYHAHADREQVYYFTQGRGKMNIDEVVYEVQRGDAVSALLAQLLLLLQLRLCVCFCFCFCCYVG